MSAGAIFVAVFNNKKEIFSENEIKFAYIPRTRRSCAAKRLINKYSLI